MAYIKIFMRFKQYNANFTFLNKNCVIKCNPDVNDFKYDYISYIFYFIFYLSITYLAIKYYFV